jgi:tRNA (guanine37-N1)-methyltransferase
VAAVRELKQEDPEVWVILLSPQGRLFDQEKARELAERPHVALVCGHYEGVDDRLRFFIDEELSIGDYIVTGGEIPALAAMDAVTRLLPGVLGGEGAADEESFQTGLLEYPQYTRPRVFEGHEVPEILLSGDHAAIARWRRQEALKRTARQRPDLLDKAALNPEDRDFLISLHKNVAKDR